MIGWFLLIGLVMFLVGCVCGYVLMAGYILPFLFRRWARDLDYAERVVFARILKERIGMTLDE